MNLLCLNIYLKFSEYFEKLKFEFSRFYCIMLKWSTLFYFTFKIFE